MKTCSYYKNYSDYVTTPKHEGVINEYAQQTFYPSHKGHYLRARYVDTTRDSNTYELVYWNLGINGYAFPDEASDILFVDDTPDHIINPEGLFNRSYVFQQFSMQKPNFNGGHEFGQPSLNDQFDDFDFHGGLFPNLVKKTTAEEPVEILKAEVEPK